VVGQRSPALASGAPVRSQRHRQPGPPRGFDACMRLRTAARRLHEAAYGQIHIEQFHFPLFRRMADRTVTTLHGRQDFPDLILKDKPLFEHQHFFQNGNDRRVILLPDGETLSTTLSIATRVISTLCSSRFAVAI
jgi:hypothetical protein